MLLNVNKMNNRERFVDIAKGIGIILVVYAHVILLTKELQELRWITKHIYSFHMPLFFVISGYCMGLKYTKQYLEKLNIKQELIKITKKLLMLYCVWSCVYIFISKAVGQGLYERIKVFVTFRGIAPIWFLGTLFGCEVLFVLVLMCKRVNNYIYGILSIVLIGVGGYLGQVVVTSVWINYLRIALGRLLIATAFLFVGYILQRVDIFGRLKRFGNLLVGSMCLIVICVIVETQSLSVNMHLLNISDYLLFVVTAILGSLGILCISNTIKKCTLLEKLGGNSLGIMLLHYTPFPTIAYSIKIVCKFCEGDLVVSVLASIIAIVISMLGIWLCKKRFFI